MPFTTNKDETVRASWSEVSTPGVVLGHRTGTRIRLVNRAPAAAASRGDRRRTDRLSPAETKWADEGRLKSGHEVRVLDISTRGVLIESPVRLPVGGRVEICLTESDTEHRLVLTGVARRCQVAGLNPMTYTGALEFEEGVELQVLMPFVNADGADGADGADADGADGAVIGTRSRRAR